MDETTKTLRNFVYESVERSMQIDERAPHSTGPSESTMSLFALFKILDTLDSIDNGVGDIINRLVAVENAIDNLNRGRV